MMVAIIYYVGRLYLAFYTGTYMLTEIAPIFIIGSTTCTITPAVIMANKARMSIFKILTEWKLKN